MDEVNVLVEVEINPTESEKKVMQAIENIIDIDGASMKKLKTSINSKFILATDGKEKLEKLRYILRRERIRAAARKVFLNGLWKRKISFFLNKQAAYKGQLSFAEEEMKLPLGSVRVKITCEEPRKLIDWLTKA